METVWSNGKLATGAAMAIPASRWFIIHWRAWTGRRGSSKRALQPGLIGALGFTYHAGAITENRDDRLP